MEWNVHRDRVYSVSIVAFITSRLVENKETWSIHILSGSKLDSLPDQSDSPLMNEELM